MENKIDGIDMPIGVEPNRAFSVCIRCLGEERWKEIFVYNVRVGHQQTPYVNSAMVKFDFKGSVELRVEYHISDIADYEIRPGSYHICAKQEGKSIYFRLEQHEGKSPKVVVRINNSWETACLHILTNPIEAEKPDKFAENVYVIKEGEDIPLYLPEGKDTYYFEKGIHILPAGLWIEYDLKRLYVVDGFLLEQSCITLSGYADGVRWEIPQRYVVEGRETENDVYEVLYDGTDNNTLGVLKKKIPSVKARFIRVRLLGSDGERFLYSNAVKQFKVYEVGTGKDLTLQAEMKAAMPCMLDGRGVSETGYGNWHAAENFFLCKDYYQVYIESGAVVKGAFAADEVSHLKIYGRGILDCSGLEHFYKKSSEDRTGAIWLISGKDLEVEGITVLDPPMWSIVLNCGERIKVRNVNLIASALNADGIHFSSSFHVTVENCFVRTCDDLLVMYHYGKGGNVWIKNCVLWSDDGHAFLFGLGSVPDASIRNIEVSECSVLDHRAAWDYEKYAGVIKLWPNGGNVIENVVFDHIHIDSFQMPEKASVFQLTTHERLEGEGHGILRNVQLKNIDYRGNNENKSLIYGVDEEFSIENVTIQNYCRNGIRADDTNAGNMIVRGYIKSLTICGNPISM